MKKCIECKKRIWPWNRITLNCGSFHRECFIKAVKENRVQLIKPTTEKEWDMYED